MNRLLSFLIVDLMLIEKYVVVSAMIWLKNVQMMMKTRL